MKALNQIIDDLPSNLSHAKLQFTQILKSKEDPNSLLSQLHSLLSSIEVPKSTLLKSTIFSSDLTLLTNKEVSIFFMQLFMVLSKSFHSIQLTQIVEKNKVFEIIVDQIKFKVTEKGSKPDSGLIFGSLDYWTTLSCYFEFLEFLNQFTSIELDYSSEKSIISLIYYEYSDLNLQSIFFTSYTKGLRFMKLSNNYFRSIRACGEIISEQASELPLSFFKLFKYLLFKVNKNSSISLINKKFHCVTSKEIIGFEYLVNLFFGSQNTLYKKCKKLIYSLLSCYSLKIVSEFDQIFKHSILTLINFCDKSKKIHKKRLISLVYFLIHNSNLKKKLENWIKVCAIFKENSKLIEINSNIHVLHLRAILAKEFKLNNCFPLFSIDNKLYGPQKNNKKLKLTSEHILNVTNEENVIEADNDSMAKFLGEQNEFFWKLFEESANEEFNMACFSIAKYTTYGPIYTSVEEYIFEPKDFISLPMSVQMEFAYSISYKSRDKLWMRGIESFSLQNSIFEFLIEFLEKNPNFNMVNEVTELISNFTDIRNFENNLYFRVFQALFFWILRNPKKSPASMETDIRMHFIIITNKLKSDNYRQFMKFLEENIDFIATYLLEVSNLINFLQFLITFNELNINFFTQVSLKFEELFSKSHLDLIWLKIRTLFDLKYKPKIIFSKLIQFLLSFQLGENEEIYAEILTLMLVNKFQEINFKISEFQNFLITFLIPSSFNKNPDFPLFKSVRLRLLSFDLVHAQCTSDSSKVPILNDALNLLLTNKSWRRSKLSFWKMKQSILNSGVEYRGLDNPGTICYSNSFIQQLFHIPTFVDPLLSLNTNEKNCLSALQKVFLKLKFSSQSSVSSNGLIKSCIGPKGLIEQMDTDEYILKLFEKCSKSEVGYQFDEIIEKNFIGVQNLEIRCKRCQKVTNKTQDFKSISLQIFKKEKNSILNSLRKMTHGEVMTGENALFCSNCKRKENSETRIKFTELPLYLIFIVKRFEYDTKIMTRVKINEVFEFTEEVNFMEFAKCKSSSNFKENFDYQLNGVINHFGTADFGHYTSYVRTSKKEWIYFNDSEVSKSSLEEVLKNSIGESEEDYNTSAYIIIYKKIEESPKSSESLTNINLETYENQFIHKITEKNEIVKSREILFSAKFPLFIIKFINFQEIQIFLVNFCLSCFFRMSISAIEKINFYREFYCNLSLTAVVYLIEIISSSPGVQEFILCNPHPEHKTFLITLIEKHVKSLEKSFLLLIFKRLLKFFADYSLSIYKCDVYLSQLFFLIVNNLEEEWKNRYNEIIHISLLVRKKINLNYVVQNFKSDFFWAEDFKMIDEPTDYNRYLENCSGMFIKYMAENFDNLDSKVLSILKSRNFIFFALINLKTKLGIIAMSQLYSKVYTNDTKGALEYIGIIVDIYIKYTEKKYLKFISLLFKFYESRTELFIHFIEFYLDMFLGSSNLESNLFIRYTIKSLRKIKYNEVASNLTEDNQEKLKNAIEIYLCQTEDEEDLRKISEAFYKGIECKEFDKDDEIDPKYLEKNKLIWVSHFEKVREYEIKDNFCNRILRLEGDDSSYLLLDYIQFDRIHLIG